MLPVHIHLNNLHAIGSILTVNWIESGKLGSKLLGIVTNRDIQFEEDLDQRVENVMVTDLITAPAGVTLGEANKILA